MFAFDNTGGDNVDLNSVYNSINNLNINTESISQRVDSLESSITGLTFGGDGITLSGSDKTTYTERTINNIVSYETTSPILFNAYNVNLNFAEVPTFTDQGSPPLTIKNIYSKSQGGYIFRGILPDIYFSVVTANYLNLEGARNLWLSNRRPSIIGTYSFNEVSVNCDLDKISFIGNRTINDLRVISGSVCLSIPNPTESSYSNVSYNYDKINAHNLARLVDGDLSYSVKNGSWPLNFVGLINSSCNITLTNTIEGFLNYDKSATAFPFANSINSLNSSYITRRKLHLKNFNFLRYSYNGEPFASANVNSTQTYAGLTMPNTHAMMILNDIPCPDIVRNVNDNLNYVYKYPILESLIGTRTETSLTMLLDQIKTSESFVKKNYEMGNLRFADDENNLYYIKRNQEAINMLRGAEQRKIYDSLAREKFEPDDWFADHGGDFKAWEDVNGRLILPRFSRELWNSLPRKINDSNVREIYIAAENTGVNYKTSSIADYHTYFKCDYVGQFCEDTYNGGFKDVHTSFNWPNVKTMKVYSWLQPSISEIDLNLSGGYSLMENFDYAISQNIKKVVAGACFKMENLTRCYLRGDWSFSKDAFINCYNLSSIFISDPLKIAAGAFYNCYNLKAIYCYTNQGITSTAAMFAGYAPASCEVITLPQL